MKMYLSKFANIADAFALEGAEVGGDTAVLEINDARKRFIEERPDGQDWEVTGFGLPTGISNLEQGKSIHGKLTARVWIMALNPKSTLPVPMISVTSCDNRSAKVS
jgi:hypothetical protein